MLAASPETSSEPPGEVEDLNEPTADSLWHAIATRLREAISETTYDTWFAYAEPRSLGDGRLEVCVPNDFTRDWIESHFHGFVSTAARETLGREVAVAFTVTDRQFVPPATPAPAAPPSQAGPPSEPGPQP